MAQIIVTSVDAAGHFAPMRVIAQDLVARGHEVAFLTGEHFRRQVGAVGASFIPHSGGPDFPTLVASPERLALPGGMPQLEWDVRHLAIAAIPSQFRNLQQLLTEAGDKPVIVVADSAVFGVTPMGFGAAGPAPKAIVSVGTTPLMVSSVDTAPFGMGLPPDSTEEGRAQNRERNRLVQEEAFGAAQQLYVRALRELGVTRERIPFFFDAPVLAPDRYLQLGIEELGYRRTDLPSTVRFLGSLPAIGGAGDSELPEWWHEVRAADRVVVVTQGTVANRDYGMLIEPTLEALADQPVLVVVAAGRDGLPRAVPDNARVARYLPFDELLPMADVLVTNGGFSTVLQALRLGTPMVVAGQTEDKLEGNVRLARTGAAINLETDRPSVDQMRTALNAVLSTGGYREDAARLASEYARHDALGLVAATVEELLAAD